MRAGEESARCSACESKKARQEGKAEKGKRSEREREMEEREENERIAQHKACKCLCALGQKENRLRTKRCKNHAPFVVRTHTHTHSLTLAQSHTYSHSHQIRRTERALKERERGRTVVPFLSSAFQEEKRGKRQRAKRQRAGQDSF